MFFLKNLDIESLNISEGTINNLYSDAINSDTIKCSNIKIEKAFNVGTIIKIDSKINIDSNIIIGDNFKIGQSYYYYCNLNKKGIEISNQLDTNILGKIEITSDTGRKQSYFQVSARDVINDNQSSVTRVSSELNESSIMLKTTDDQKNIQTSYLNQNGLEIMYNEYKGNNTYSSVRYYFDLNNGIYTPKLYVQSDDIKLFYNYGNDYVTLGSYIENIVNNIINPS